ncbi:hypothetical protein ACU4GD_23405 [Cupriavidus basilensis]
MPPLVETGRSGKGGVLAVLWPSRSMGSIGTMDRQPQLAHRDRGRGNAALKAASSLDARHATCLALPSGLGADRDGRQGSRPHAAARASLRHARGDRRRDPAGQRRLSQLRWQRDPVVSAMADASFVTPAAATTLVSWTCC